MNNSKKEKLYNKILRSKTNYVYSNGIQTKHGVLDIVQSSPEKDQVLTVLSENIASWKHIDFPYSFNYPLYKTDQHVSFKFNEEIFCIRDDQFDLQHIEVNKGGTGLKYIQPNSVLIGNGYKPIKQINLDNFADVNSEQKLYYKTLSSPSNHIFAKGFVTPEGELINISPKLPSKGQILVSKNKYLLEWSDPEPKKQLEISNSFKFIDQELFLNLVDVNEGGTGHKSLLENNVLLGNGEKSVKFKKAPHSDFVGVNDHQELCHKTLQSRTNEIIANKIFTKYSELDFSNSQIIKHSFLTISDNNDVICTQIKGIEPIQTTYNSICLQYSEQFDCNYGKLCLKTLSVNDGGTGHKELKKNSILIGNGEKSIKFLNIPKGGIIGRHILNSEVGRIYNDLSEVKKSVKSQKQLLDRDISGIYDYLEDYLKKYRIQLNFEINNSFDKKYNQLNEQFNQSLNKIKIPNEIFCKQLTIPSIDKYLGWSSEKGLYWYTIPEIPKLKLPEFSPEYFYQKNNQICFKKDIIPFQFLNKICPESEIVGTQDSQTLTYKILNSNTNFIISDGFYDKEEIIYFNHFYDDFKCFREKIDFVHRNLKEKINEILLKRNVKKIVPVSKGGTGYNFIPKNSILIGNDSGEFHLKKLNYSEITFNRENQELENKHLISKSNRIIVSEFFTQTGSIKLNTKKDPEPGQVLKVNEKGIASWESVKNNKDTIIPGKGIQCVPAKKDHLMLNLKVNEHQFGFTKNSESLFIKNFKNTLYFSMDFNGLIDINELKLKLIGQHGLPQLPHGTYEITYSINFDQPITETVCCILNDHEHKKSTLRLIRQNYCTKTFIQKCIQPKNKLSINIHDHDHIIKDESYWIIKKIL